MRDRPPYTGRTRPSTRTARAARNRWPATRRLRGQFQRLFPGEKLVPPLAAFHQVLDLVLIDKQVGTVFAREPDERVVVILDGARDLLAIGEFHAYGDFRLDQMLEVSHLFKGLFGSAIPGFSAWS